MLKALSRKKLMTDHNRLFFSHSIAIDQFLTVFKAQLKLYVLKSYCTLIAL